MNHKNKKLPPEIIFILQLFSIGVDLPSEITVESINWDKFLNYIIKNKLILLYPIIKENVAVWNIIPENFQEKWQKMFHYKVCKNILLRKTVLNILEKLDEEKCQAIVLKGPALSKNLYNDDSLRFYSDLDLLIQKKDLPIVKKVLKSLEYSPEDQSFLSKWYLTRNHIHLRFLRENSSFPIEVHWMLDHKYMLYSIDYEKIFAQGRQIELLGTSAYAMSPADEVLSLFLHVYKHCTYLKYRTSDILLFIFENGDFLNFYELRLLIKKYRDKLNINELLHKIKLWNVDIPIYYTFSLLQEVFENSTAKEVVSKLDIPKVSYMEYKIFQAYSSTKLEGKRSKLGFFDYMRLLDLYNYFLPGKRYLKEKYSNPLSLKRFYLFYFCACLAKLFLNGLQFILYKLESRVCCFITPVGTS